MTPHNAASRLWLFCLHREIALKNQIKKIKITPKTPKNESGLIQLIMIGESIRQIWVKVRMYDDVNVARQNIMHHCKFIKI